MPSTCNRLFLLATCIGLSLLTGVTLAQPRPEGRGRGGPGGGPFGFGGGPVELLQRADVQAELELLDDQKNDLRALVEKSNERRREVLGGFAEQFRNREVAEADREALRENFQEAMRKLSDEVELGLSFLLPHQRKRLSQLELQFQMRGGGGLGALGSPEIGEQLAVTEQQRAALREKALELGQEFGKKIAELRREMQDKLLAELNPEQQAKFKEMLGDPFEFQDRPPGGGPGQGPPRGGERQ